MQNNNGMSRRGLLRPAAGLGFAGLLGAQTPRRGMPSPRIRDISVIETEPAGVRLSVVKVTTDQDGLYGYGCATFTQRAELIRPAVEKYLKPLLVNRPADRIEDIGQTAYASSYWKNGPVLNNALSGVDQALWDIKGCQVGLPVYQLAGGKVREAAECYSKVAGASYQETVELAKQSMAAGFRNVRVQVGDVRVMVGEPAANDMKPGLTGGLTFDRLSYCRRTLKLLEICRQELGAEVGLLHDMGEKVAPNEAVQFCKDVEPLKPFFIEDPLAPEDLAYFRQIRSNCTTPIAMGELFDSPHQWQELIAGRLIDYIRVHPSQAGGFTPSRKIAILAEQFGVKIAWHGPPDLSPVGHMVNLTLDLISPNFGIQEYSPFNGPTQEIFAGCPVLKNGYLWINEAPGWGIEIDERAAAKYPYGTGETGDRKRLNGGWGDLRLRDGTPIK
jgi:mannonate dehydratase